MSNLPDTQQADAALVHLYRLLPPYVFGEGLLHLTGMWYQNQLGMGSAHASDWDVAGLAYTYLPCQAVGYACLLLLL
eukprot:7129234-Prymnesium_polylepis.1